MPDRFTEEEARRVFARAAERQHTAEAAPAGLSREELEEIGRASGLDPAHVAAAIAEVRAGVPDHAPKTVWGIDLEPRATRVIPGEVSDDAWGRMVARLRDTFGTRGTPTQIGRVREWTGSNSQGGTSNLHVTVEPVEGGTRVTVASSKAHEAAGLSSLPWISAVLLALPTLLVALGDFGGEAFALPALLTVAFGVMGASFAWYYRRWSRTRQGQFDALMDQFDLIARADAASGREVAAEATVSEAPPRLDLDALPDEAPAASEPESPRRVRS